MLPGVRLGIDVGKARIGVAKSDASAFLASPLTTIKRAASGDEDVKQLKDIIAEHNVQVVYVGDPINLKGKRTLSTLDAYEFARKIAGFFAEVRMVDERFSTVTAQSNLGATGKTVKKTKGIIDQAAAAVLLQNALDDESFRRSLAGVHINDISNDGEDNGI